MSPIKPRGPAVKPSRPKVDDPDQTIAEPPRDFTDEIFKQLTGGNADELPPVTRPENTLPMAGRPAAGAPPPNNVTLPMNPPDPFGPPAMPPHAPPPTGSAPQLASPSGPQLPAPSTPQIYMAGPQSGPISGPMSAPQSKPQGAAGDVQVRTPLWALAYLGIALVAIAFGLFVLYTQSRVVGHF